MFNVVYRYAANSPAHRAKVSKVMGEFKAGTLKSSSGQRVTKRSQAIAIALSEAKHLSQQEAREYGFRSAWAKGAGAVVDTVAAHPVASYLGAGAVIGAGSGYRHGKNLADWSIKNPEMIHEQSPLSTPTGRKLRTAAAVLNPGYLVGAMAGGVAGMGRRFKKATPDEKTEYLLRRRIVQGAGRFRMETGIKPEMSPKYWGKGAKGRYLDEAKLGKNRSLISKGENGQIIYG